MLFLEGHGTAWSGPYRCGCDQGLSRCSVRIEDLRKCKSCLCGKDVHSFSCHAVSILHEYLCDVIFASTTNFRICGRLWIYWLTTSSQRTMTHSRALLKTVQQSAY
jgi:hypothetical protein